MKSKTKYLTYYSLAKTKVMKRATHLTINLFFLTISCLLIGFYFHLISYPTSAQANASHHSSSINHMKAAYLLNFIQFIEWPKNSPSETIKIAFLCKLQSQEFKDTLKELSKRKVGLKNIDITTFEKLTKVSKLKNYKAVYVAEDMESDLESIILSLIHI